MLQSSPLIEEKITHDDNVFRISKDVDPVGAIGFPSRGDTYRTLKMDSIASLGFSSQAESGRFSKLEPIAGSLVDNTYRQYSAGIVADWTPTDASHASGRIERSVRRYEQLSQRDFDGTTGRAEYDWKPTDKFSLSLIAQRDISPYEYINSRLVLVSGITVSPALRLSEKTELSGTFDDSVRNYRGDPTVVLGAAVGRRDRVRSSMVMFSYRPMQTVWLQISAQHEKNISNVVFGDYGANVVSATARFSF